MISEQWEEVDERLHSDIKMGLLAYLKETLEGTANDSRSQKNLTQDVKTFYIRQIDYFKHNPRSKLTFILNYDHLSAFKFHNESLVNCIQERYLELYEVLRNSVYSFLSSYIEKTDGFSRDNVFVGFTEFLGIKTLREILCYDIGKLTCVTGTVTRTSEIRPELFRGVFNCSDCGTRSKKVFQRFVYTKPLGCENVQCKNTKNFTLAIDDSELINFQKLRIQENTEDIPSGTIPRTIEVILRNDLVDNAKPGDKTLFYGTFFVIPEISKLIKNKIRNGSDNPEDKKFSAGRKKSNDMDVGVTGLKVLGVRDMSYRLGFLAHYCKSKIRTGSRLSTSILVDPYSNEEKESEGLELINKGEEFLKSLEQKEIQILTKMKNDSKILENLVDSICPQIHGYNEIKTGLLLQMVGGVHKKTEEGIKLRGDINIILVGDPGTGKSQFLKYVAKILPRAIYTSGKASSSSGLTASVVKNVDTNDFSIEAGALLLADKGICCIDEFDKMNVYDQVAIHEAMEQQTISIAKAGIRATLQARAAILAAANPVGGKYDTSKTLRANIGYSLSPALISRFDLFFIICDKFNEDSDLITAQHILSVHKGNFKPPVYSDSDTRLYIRYIQSTYQPSLSAEAINTLNETYVKMRKRDKLKNQSYRITVRQLESLVRLSEAIARIYCDETVRKIHAVKAISLLQKTQIKLDLPDIDLDFGDPEDYIITSRKADKKRRKELYFRIKQNFEESKERFENVTKRIEEKNKELNNVEEKISKLTQEQRKIIAGLSDKNADDIEYKLKKWKDDKDLIEGDLKDLKRKLDYAKRKKEDCQKIEKTTFSQLSLDLRNEIEKEENDTKLRNPKKKKRKKEKKVTITQEQYKSCCLFFTDYIKNKEKKKKKFKNNNRRISD